MKALGLDIGTTSICTVVISSQAEVLQTLSAPNTSALAAPAGQALQDPAVILATARQQVHTLLARHPEVQAIGITGQMHGILYLDSQLKPLGPLTTWQDSRADLPFQPGMTWGGRLQELTGQTVPTGYGLATHFYNLHHRLVPPGARWMVTIGDWLALQLSGAQAPAMDPSNAASLGLFDLARGQFDQGALAAAGIDPEILPPVAPGCLGTGKLGVPVYTAIGDNQAAFLGAVGRQEGVLLVNVGTGSQVALYSRILLTLPGLETRPLPGGGFLLVGASLCGGKSYALLEQFFRQTAQALTGQTVSGYEAMARLLEQTPMPQDLPVTRPTFLGTRLDPAAQGSITGITLDNFTPVHLTYSFMEGMAQELYGMYHSYLAAGGAPLQKLVGSGNGLRKNPHLCRTFAQVFGCPVEVSACQEEAACGAAAFALEQTRKTQP